MSVQYCETFAAKVTPISDGMLDSEGNLIDTELLILTSIIDPNILKIYNYFLAEGCLIIILEYCPGGTVLDWISENNKISSDSLAIFTRQIAHSLNACHKMNIAHRDIKPANIFIDKYGRPKIGDFGLSSILSKSSTKVKSPRGTEFYAAPEIFKKADYDPFKADSYAFGITLYQLSTGSLPWNDKSEATMLKFPEDYNRALKELILRMTEEDPVVRLSMEEICK